jgi:hypothetical protein
MGIHIKQLDKWRFMVNGKEVDTMIPMWGANLTNQEYKALQNFRSAIRKFNTQNLKNISI